MEDKQQDKPLGAIWSKTSPKGDYFSGNIEINGEKIGIVVFANNKRGNDKAPDWRILRSRPKEPREQAPSRDDEPPMPESDVPF